jgi:hypothetical protein
MAGDLAAHGLAAGSAGRPLKAAFSVVDVADRLLDAVKDWQSSVKLD